MIRVAVFGSLVDPQVTHFISSAMKRGHRVVQLAPEAWNGDGKEGHAIESDRLRGLRAELGLEDPFAVDVAYVHQLPPLFPPIEARLGLPPIERQALLEFVNQARDRAAFVTALLNVLEVERKPVINPPARQLGVRNHAVDLVRLSRSGISVPDLVITDEARTAYNFASRRERCTIQSLSGGEAARVLERSDIERFGSLDSALNKAPVLIQQAPKGRTARAFVIDRELFSLSGDDTVLPIRRAIAEVCVEACRVLGLIFAELTIHLDEDQPTSCVVSAVNATPSYLEVEQRFDHPLTDRLLDTLESRRS
jgi:glutathione synthase/RimK-type ligase-like ATP-grasp enzyme